MQEPLSVECRGNNMARVSVISPDAKVSGNKIRSIELNLGVIVDSQCTRSKIPGDLVAVPNMGSAILMSCQLDNCDSLLSVEPVYSEDNLNGWVRRSKHYHDRCVCKGMGLEIETMWTCDSSKMKFGTMPWSSGKGVGRMGFAVTKHLPKGVVVDSLNNYVITGRMPSKSDGFLTGMYRWVYGKVGFTWSQEEERFLKKSMVGPLLKKLITENGGWVPTNMTAQSIGIMYDGAGNIIKPVILPFPGSFIKIANADREQVVRTWVDQTMRDMWFQIVAAVEGAMGITGYKPTSPKLTMSMSFVAGMGLGIYTPIYSEWFADTLGGLMSPLFATIGPLKNDKNHHQQQR